MSTIAVFFYVLSITFIKVCKAQIADCQTMFISDTNPGIFYEMYYLNLNGAPIGVPKSPISTYLSSLSFTMPYMFADNVPGLNFNVPVTAGDNEVVEGEIYGRPITVSNFSFSASAWLRVPKTGWYIFDMKADSGAELFIVNYTTVYCCKNPSNANFNMQFKITSLPLEPAVEHPTDKVYLYKDFPYELLFSYINLNSSAYLDIHVTDPDGIVHTDLTDFTQQMNQKNITEIVTCDYVINQSLVTQYWTGTVTSTLTTSRTYSLAPNGTVLITDVDIVGIPNPVPSQDTSSSRIESRSTSLIKNSVILADFPDNTSNIEASMKTSVTKTQNSTISSTSETQSSTLISVNMSSIIPSSGKESLNDTSVALTSRIVDTKGVTMGSSGSTWRELSNKTSEISESKNEWNSQPTQLDDTALSSVTHKFNFNKSRNSQISSNIFFFDLTSF